MDAHNTNSLLDRDQLRNVTLDDEELMREIVAALVDDTSRQMQLLHAAIAEQDATRCMRLAHYSKGACANVGAYAAAAILKEIESKAASARFAECSLALAQLADQVEQLRSAATSL